MREISVLEIQSVAGGFSFGGIGSGIGSAIGGIGDKIFGVFGVSTALSSTLGQAGLGIGQLFDAPFAGSLSGTVTALKGAASNIVNGVVGSNVTVIAGLAGLFKPAA